LGEEARQELAHQLYNSAFERLPPLHDFTEIFPGHGAGSLCGKAIGSRSSSTIGFERRYNGALTKKPERVWVDDLMREMPLSPPYFARMKQVNRTGPAIIGPELPGQRRWSAQEVEQRVCEDCLILDVRAKEAFAAAHISGAINIPLGAVMPTWAGWVLPYDRPTLLVLDDPRRMSEVTTHLLRVGFDDVRGYLEGGMEAWENAGFPFASLATISVQRLRDRLSNQHPLTVLDVRTEQEWNAGHVSGALHIHGGTLEQRVGEVPKEHPVAVICGSGYRASIAASFLKREGFADVSNVMGGMSAWKGAGFPVTRD
jgi:hydroxyacylglutathione hydrolase